MNNYLLIIWILVSIVFESAADYWLKTWTENPRNLSLLICLALYNGMLFTWIAAASKSKSISIVGTVWLLLGHAALLVVGVGMFHEKISACQWVGLGFAAASFVLISL